MSKRSLFCLLLLVSIQVAYGTKGDYEKRLAFASKVTDALDQRATKQEVAKLLGDPSCKKTYLPNADLSPQVAEAWLYSSKNGSTFAGLGTVWFGNDGRVCKAAGFKKPSPEISSLEVDIDTWMDLLSTTPGLYARTFQSKKVVEICSKLVDLPFKDAMCLLKEFHRVKPILEATAWGPALALYGRWDGNDGQVGILLSTLFAGDKEMGTDVFLHFDSLKPNGNHLKKDKAIGEILVCNGWPVVVAEGHFPASGRSLELDLLAVAGTRTAFTYVPPATKEPRLEDFMALCGMVEEALASRQYFDQVKGRIERQLGLQID